MLLVVKFQLLEDLDKLVELEDFLLEEVEVLEVGL